MLVGSVAIACAVLPSLTLTPPHASAQKASLSCPGAFEGQPLTIYGDGNQTRDFVYVANVVHATVLAARAPAARVAGQVFNVGCAQSVSINDLWDRIQTLTGVPVLPKRGEGRPGEITNSLASIDKARELVGYEPSVDFDEGLRQTVAYYRARRRERRRVRAA